eukprot:TRINITY_DN2886_c0_g4_i3.p1 TRINITY_DN2886_c0_g4~~TRINITY_DN2886_c0_g4_i3.p1  ORF type:complete len:380 (+),score=79.50 TRINITY_DN2886_c0_g4_i3:126-1265(+)
MATPTYIELQEYGRHYNETDGIPDRGVRRGDEDDEEEAAGVPEDEEDDPFLYYAMAHEDEEDEDDEERRRRNNNNQQAMMNAASGWQSKNETSRTAKLISKYLAVMKLTKERQNSSNNLSSSSSSVPLRQSNSSVVVLDEDDLLRAADLGIAEQQQRCDCLPKKLNHVYMCVLFGLLIFVAGGGLLVMGLLSEFEFVEATAHETRLLATPNTWWYDCVSWRRFAIRSPKVNNDRPRSASPVGEAEIYLFDSMPRYLSQPRINSQMREVDLAPDDSKIHYVQFFINAGGVANFAWSFRPDVNSSNTDTAGGGATLSPIDVLWVKGTTAFESLAGIGMGKTTQRSNERGSHPCITIITAPQFVRAMITILPFVAGRRLLPG